MSPTCGKSPCYARPTDRGEPYCLRCQGFVSQVAQAKAHKSPPRANSGQSSELETLYENCWNDYRADLPDPELEYRVFLRRQWKIDRAWPDVKIAVEIEGWGHGLSRYEGDVAKYNALAADGWILLRCTRKMLTEDPQPFFELLRQCYYERKWKDA